MSKRDFTLDRSRKKRVCECGGELKLLGVDYSFRPHASCLKCGKERIGFEGTKEANDD